MTSLNLVNILQLLKKGKAIMLALPFFVLSSCANFDPNEYGKLRLHQNSQNKSFTFYVDNKFHNLDLKPKKSPNNPKMTLAESKLLETLLEEKDYCLNALGKPQFKIISKQEKIYDMTFAHLIEKNYQAQPISPTTYFGICK